MLFCIETESVQLVDFQTADSCFINANISEKNHDEAVVVCCCEMYQIIWL